MFIIDGTISSDITLFLERITVEVPTIQIIPYAQWLTNRPTTLKGIIYLRVTPEIAYTRIQKHAASTENLFALDHITAYYQQQENLFVKKTTLPAELQQLPVLVLNGNIDFTTDFAHFYNHLFYIKKFLKGIQDIHDLEHGIEPKKHRNCC